MNIKEQQNQSCKWPQIHFSQIELKKKLIYNQLINNLDKCLDVFWILTML